MFPLASASRNRFGRVRWAALAVVVGVLIALVPIGPPAAADPGLAPPLPPPLLVLRSFAPPPEPWDAGSRGVDLAATAGEPVFAGAAGQVIYAGLLAGRGVVSIADGSIHLTYEPLDPSVAVGSWVVAGAVIGHVSDEIDDCGPPGSCLHWGVRSGSGYLDPIALLGVPTVRLLPIWSDVAPEAAVTMTAAAATARPVGEPRACPLPKLAPQCW